MLTDLKDCSIFRVVLNYADYEFLQIAWRNQNKHVAWLLIPMPNSLRMNFNYYYKKTLSTTWSISMKISAVISVTLFNPFSQIKSVLTTQKDGDKRVMKSDEERNPKSH